MRIFTTGGRWLFIMLIFASFATTAYAQRTVTLTLNTATIPDTTLTTDLIEVRGAVDSDADGIFEAPFTFIDNNVIDWGDASTLEPVNMGGDYWQVQFQLDNTAELQFKYFSFQKDADQSNADGWEADPNPRIAPGVTDTTLTLHFFEAKDAYRDLAVNDKGAYDWRPYEEREDMIAVWYRVYMCTVDGQNKGYVPSDPAMVVGVRGDGLGGNGALDWGTSNVQLMQESAVDGATGYNLWSGVGYYPAAAAGTVQPYKYVVEDGAGTTGWEEGNLAGDRTFTVPAADTTLHWVYFGADTPAECGAVPVAGTVIFTVDTTPLAQIGLFNVARGDTMEVRGDFNGWDCDNPDDCLLLRFPGTNQFDAEVPLTYIPGSRKGYKYYLNFHDENFRAEFGAAPPSGWEEPISTQGANRYFEFEGLVGQDLGIQFFNDIYPENIIPDGVTVDVNFSVDMTTALSPSTYDPFDTAAHGVYVEMTGDALWAFTQDIPRNADGGFIVDPNFVLTDGDQNMVYTGTFALTGPTYAAIQYKYSYGVPPNSLNTEGGGSTETEGRRRTRFITPNPDGTWPATWDFVAESYQESGSLPFEANPATATSIEQVGTELPTQVTLSDNYPNPFNPTTTFEYSINKTQNVQIQVFDILGRTVATLVDGVQKPATYKVSFDATNLASGTYIYRMVTPGHVLTKKMVLIK